MPAPVSKPANAGAGSDAIADTKTTWVNLRSGPGVEYDTVGRVYDYTFIKHYPASQRGAWRWVEQYGRAGWVSTDFVGFVQPSTPPPGTDRPTPYDGHVALWHWEGDAVEQDSIEELVMTIKQNVPAVTQLWVKTSDGAAWQGQYDSKKALAIDSAKSLDRWAQVLSIYQIELHAWCIPVGQDLQRETDIIIQTANHPAVKSLILDVEPDPAHYWAGGKDRINPYMRRIRQGITKARFHIGFCPDPRPWHYNDLFPEEWFPFVDSVHPQTYWATFGYTPEEALDQVYNTWLPFGKPVIPALQAAAPAGEILGAHTLATKRYNAKGLSWWRWGVVGPVEFKAINLPISSTTPTPQPQNPAPAPGSAYEYGDEIVVTPDMPAFAKGTYTGREEFTSFRGQMGWTVYYTPTAKPGGNKVWAMWVPQLPQSGLYQVEVYIHQPHATAANARYKIHGVKGQPGSEAIVAINQSQIGNQWYPLGVFDLDKALPNVGRVFLNDVTGETGEQVTFDAVRWRRVVKVNPTTPPPVRDGELIIDGVYYADGFDAPIGTAVERSGTAVWPATWRDAAPFAQPYSNRIAVHTGADLTLGGTANADFGMPVYAAGSGVVLFAAERPGWGNMVVIKHDPLANSGIVMSSRYAHLGQILVKAGERVRRGQQIGTIGSSRGMSNKTWSPHLHFDLCIDNTLERTPEHWPSAEKPKPLVAMTEQERSVWLESVANEIRRHYVEPQIFIQTNRPARR